MTMFVGVTFCGPLSREAIALQFSLFSVCAANTVQLLKSKDLRISESAALDTLALLLALLNL